MAILKSGILFTGSIGGMTAYKRKDLDDIQFRQKGGPTAKAIKTSPRFENVRRTNREFGARSTMSKWIRMALLHHRHVADYNFTSTLNALVKPIQELDTTSEWGKRNVFLSRNRKLLEGFTLNQKYSLETYVHAPISCSLSRNEALASVEIPPLYPDVNFFSTQLHPYYKFVIALGSVPDMVYEQNRYTPAVKPVHPIGTSTDWYAWGESFPGVTLTLTGTPAPPDPLALILTVGIEFGTPTSAGKIERIKKGAARIMMAV